jgi:hypothetical protein
MRNPFPSESRIARRLWGALVARFTSVPRPKVIFHDPEASRPHDLDDPFFDPDVQQRAAEIIAGAARKQT